MGLRPDVSGARKIPAWTLEVTLPDGRKSEARHVAQLFLETAYERARYERIDHDDNWIAHLQNAASVVTGAVSAYGAAEPLRTSYVVDTFVDAITRTTEVLERAEGRDPGRQVRDFVAVANMFDRLKGAMSDTDVPGVERIMRLQGQALTRALETVHGLDHGVADTEPAGNSGMTVGWLRDRAVRAYQELYSTSYRWDGTAQKATFELARIALSRGQVARAQNLARRLDTAGNWITRSDFNEKRIELHKMIRQARRQVPGSPALPAR
jgi:hypothetical protein